MQGEKMKKGLFMVLFVLAVCAATAVFFSCAKKGPVLTIANNTGYDLYTIVIYPASSGDWDEDDEIDVLDDVLHNGNIVKVTLPSSGPWDLMAIDEDDDLYVKYDFTAAKNTSIYINPEDLD
jgi:hypothetical protein